MAQNPLDPGPTKDSNYSVKWGKKGTYPMSSRTSSRAAVNANITRQFPAMAEFGGESYEMPSKETVDAYRVFLQQSEFKKPYKGAGGYHEMEANADPLPGLTIDYTGRKLDNPSIPNINEPIIPPGYEPVTIIFNAYIDEAYEYGGYCRGNVADVRVDTTEPCYGITVTYSEPGTTVQILNTNLPANAIFLRVTAANNQFGMVTVEMLMRSFEGITGDSNVNIMEVVCSEYFMLTIEEGAVHVATIYDMTNEEIATNIPDNAETGTVSMPCNYNELTFFLANATALEVQAIATEDFNPSWSDGVTEIDQPEHFGYCNDSSCWCSNANSNYGGVWPSISSDLNESAPVNGIGCNHPISETNYDDDEYTYSFSIKWDPGCQATTQPFSEVWYGELDKEYFGKKICATITGLTDGGGVGIMRTFLHGESTMYWHENADTTPAWTPPPPDPPPTDIGSGGWLGTFDYNMEFYTFLDSAPMIEWEHTVSHGEGWTKTFRISGTVTGFSRAFNGVGEPRGNYAGVVAKGFSRYVSPFGLYGAHSAVWGVFGEVWKVTGTKLNDGGTIASSLFTNWEDHSAITVTDNIPYFGCHAGVSYTEEFAETINICNDLSRSGGLEGAVEDLLDKYKSESGMPATEIANADSMTVAATIIM